MWITYDVSWLWWTIYNDERVCDLAYTYILCLDMALFDSCRSCVDSLCNLISIDDFFNYEEFRVTTLHLEHYINIKNTSYRVCKFKSTAQNSAYHSQKIDVDIIIWLQL